MAANRTAHDMETWREDLLAQVAVSWVLGCVFVYGALFGTGSFLYGHTAQGTFWAIACVISGIWLVRLLRR